MTAEVEHFPKTKRPQSAPRCHDRDLDDVGNQILAVAQELGVIHWAAFGMAEVEGAGDDLRGIEHIAGRLQGELFQIASKVKGLGAPDQEGAS